MSTVSPLPEEARAQEIGQFLLNYKFGLDEMLTKINILREELAFRGTGNPIEHVSSRLKSIDSLRAKAERIGCPLELDAIAEQITDIAGVRIVCAFIADAYQVLDMLTTQPDVTVRAIKDYVARPKPNGYRSLHAIVDVGVVLSTGRCRSAPSPWTSGRASSTRSTTSTPRTSRASWSPSSPPRPGSRTTWTSGWASSTARFTADVSSPAPRARSSLAPRRGSRPAPARRGAAPPA